MVGSKRISTDQSLVDALIANSELHPGKTAWIERSVDNHAAHLTWLQINALAAAMAKRLQTMGVRHGSVVLQWGRNSLEWILVDLACSYLQAIHAPLDPRLSFESAVTIRTALEPAVVLVDTHMPLLPNSSIVPNYQELSTASMLTRSKRELRGNDGGNLLFTSGTTSEPRAVHLSQTSLLSNAHGKLDAMPQLDSDHRLNVLSFAHAYARTCELTTWLLSGGSMETVHGIEAFLDRLCIAQPTLINAVPSVYSALLERWRDQSNSFKSLNHFLGGSVRQLASGGAPLGAKDRKEFKESGLDIYQGYGLTEAGPVVCSNRAATSDNAPVLLGVGPPVSNTTIKLDADGRLWVQGAGVMSGYWLDEKGTRARLVDGWLDTQDRAEIDIDGKSIRIVGRMDDLIILQNGYKLNPLPIEARLLEESWVNDCFLFGSGKPHCTLVLKPKSGSFPSDMEETRRMIASVLPFEVVRVIGKIQFSQHPWTGANGLCNSKGGKKRAELANFYSSHFATD